MHFSYTEYIKAAFRKKACRVG